MSAEEFAKELGLTKEGHTEGNFYVIDLDNSNEYSNVYNILDRSDKLELDLTSIKLDDTNNQVVYVSDDHSVVLNADFDRDVYTVMIK